MMLRAAAIAVAMLTLGGTAHAADPAPCAADMVCASAPQTVFAALARKGQEPVMGKDDTGDPMIDGKAAGYNFTIFFYGCKDAGGCNSLQFVATFKAESTHTPELANRWNVKKRFSQMSIEPDKRLNFRYDVNMLGGLSRANFEDTLEWWETMLNEFSDFFSEEPAPAAK